jgi:chorismate--pyruvate lyase
MELTLLGRLAHSLHASRLWGWSVEAGLDGLRQSPHEVWRARELSGAALTGPWKLLLLGDGSPTRHLELLTGCSVVVDVEAMAADSCSLELAPEEVAELEAPLLRRQVCACVCVGIVWACSLCVLLMGGMCDHATKKVWLTCGGQTLIWAESWWNMAQASITLTLSTTPDTLLALCLSVLT